MKILKETRWADGPEWLKKEEDWPKYILDVSVFDTNQKEKQCVRNEDSQKTVTHSITKKYEKKNLKKTTPTFMPKRVRTRKLDQSTKAELQDWLRKQLLKEFDR